MTTMRGPLTVGRRRLPLACALTLATALSAGAALAGDGVWTTTFPEGGDVYGAKLEIDAANPARLWVAPQWRGIYTSADGAATWTSLTDDQPALPFNRTNVVLLLSDPASGTLYLSDGSLYRSADGGQNWSWAGSGVAGYAVSLAVDPDSGVLYAGTDGGALFKSTDGAASWGAVGAGSLPGNAILELAVDPATPTTVYAGLQSNGIWRSTDGGATWADWSNGAPLSSVLSIAIDPTDSLVIWLADWAGGADGVYKTTDGGANWVLQAPGVSFDGTGRKIAIDPTATDTVYVAGGGVFETTDGGATWSSTAACDRAASVVLDAATPATLYAGCYQLGVYKSIDGNTTWTPASSGLRAVSFPHSKSHALMIDPASTSDVYAGAHPGYQSTDGGATWGGLPLPEGSAGAFASGSIYAMTNGLYRSGDGGATWVDATGGTLCCFQEGDVAVHPADPQTVYFAGYGSGSAADGVYKTTDGGAGWNPVNNGLASTQIRALAVDPNDGNTLYAGAREGGPSGVFKTTDGGADWFQLGGGLPGDFHVDQILVHPQDSNVVLLAAEGSNSGIYRSDDGGGTWTQILAENTNAVAVNPNECCPPAQTIYAGTWSSGGFYRSLDGGQSWALVNDGLPFQPGIEAIQVDPADTDRVLIATTGGVWEHRFAGTVELTVTHTGDSGPGSLRDALTQADQDGLPTVIRFHPGIAPGTIDLASPLPGLNAGATTIDGDVDGDCVPDIELNGGAVGCCDGIRIASAGNAVRGLIINTGFHRGVLIDGPGATGNLVECNFIGTDFWGSGPAGNNLGVMIQNGAGGNQIGGDPMTQRNVISGNDVEGIRLTAADANTIRGNLVGTAVNGLDPVGNGGEGILVDNGSSGNDIGPDNTIAFNGADGVIVVDGIDEQYPLFTALVPDGTAIFPGAIDFTDDGGGSPFRQVGGGPIVDGGGGTFHDTFGMRLTGTLGVSMGGSYTFTFERLDDNAHLWVDGSIDHEAAGPGDSVSGFLTLGGHDFTLAFREHPGAADLRLTISGPGTVTFTTDAALGPCLDAQPGLCGEFFQLRIASDGNTITENAIHDNGGLGIDLAGGGVNHNDPGDADVGPNTRLDFPEITAVTDLGGGDFQLDGTAPPGATVEVFARQPDPSGFGEGQAFLGAVVASGLGNWSRVVNLPPGYFSVTATATDPAGNTSEFSGGLPLLVNALTVTNANDSGPGSLRDALQQANADGTFTTIAFDPGMAGQVIHLLSQLPDLTEDETTIDADFGGDCVPDVELDGSLAGAFADGLAVVSADNLVRGLAFVDFGGDGLKVAAGLAPGAGAGNVVECNHIGMRLDGSPGGNGKHGVWVGYLSSQTGAGASDNRIGPANVIAHNGSNGINVSDGDASPYPDYSGLGPADAVAVFAVLEFGDPGGFFTSDGFTPVDGGGAPFSDHFGMRLSGTVSVGAAGGYTFTLDADNQARLVVDGDEVVGVDHGQASNGVFLSGAHAIEVDFHEGCGGARLTVSAAGPGTVGFTTDGALGGACAGGQAGLCGELFRFRLPAERNTLTENRLVDNDALGISLDSCQGSPNPIPSDPGDLDLGANTWLNHPEITGHVDNGGGSFDLTGTAPANSTVEVFAASPDPSGYGEGAEHLVTVPADGAGDWSAPGVSVPTAFFDLTATATDALGNTSEFGPALRVKTPDAVALADASGFEGEEVLVPITVCDRAATPLGMDSGAGNRIQGFALQVTFAPAAGIAAAVAEKAGIAAPLTPLFEASNLAGDTLTYVASYDEGGSPLPFTLDADPPGCDQVARLRITLDPLAPPTPIALTLAATSALSNQAGTVTEEPGAGTLELFHGTLTVQTRAATELLAVAASSSTIELYWTDPQADELGFDVERSTDGASWVPVVTLNDPNASSHTDSGLAPATLYYYRVISFGPGGDNPPSNVATAVTFPAQAAKICPQQLSAPHTWARGAAVAFGSMPAMVYQERASRTDDEVLLQFLDAQGLPAGATVTLSAGDAMSQLPAVTWNGSRYAVMWGESMRGEPGQVHTGDFLTLVDSGGQVVRRNVALEAGEIDYENWDRPLIWDGTHWSRFTLAELDPPYTDIEFRRYGADGDLDLGPVRVTDTDAWEQYVAADWSGGHHGVAWLRQPPGGGPMEVLFERRLADGSDADPGPPTVLWTAGPDQSAFYSDVAWDGTQWAVAWTVHDVNVPTVEGDEEALFLQRVGGDGLPIGAPVRISDDFDPELPGDPWPVYDELPQLSLRPGGGFAVLTTSFTFASGWEAGLILTDAAGLPVEVGGRRRQLLSAVDGHDSFLPRGAVGGGSLFAAWGENRQGSQELGGAVADPVTGGVLQGPSDLTCCHTGGEATYAGGAGRAVTAPLGGGFVAAWTDRAPTGTNRLYARGFAGDGSVAFDLSPVSGRELFNVPALVGVGDSFALAYKDTGQTVVFQRFDAAGGALTPEVEVATAAGGGPIASLAWSGEEYGVAWLDAGRLVFRRLDPAGNPIGGQALLGTAVVGPNPGVHWTGTGWALLWRQWDAGTPDLYFGFVDPFGAVVADQVPLTTFGILHAPFASGFTFDPVTGQRLVGAAWMVDQGVDPPGNELYFRIFDLTGAPVTAELPLSAENLPSRAVVRGAGDRFSILSAGGGSFSGRGVLEDQVEIDGTVQLAVRRYTNRGFADSVADTGNGLALSWTQLREPHLATTGCLDDSSPPSCPVPTLSVADGRVQLAWGPVGDPDSGIWRYDLYRDGRMIAELFDDTTSFTDEGAPIDAPALAYELRAMNGAFLESVGCPVVTVSTIAGDANCDGEVAASNGDIFFLIAFLFEGGPAPICDADANGDGSVTVGDIFYLVNYVHGGGPPPALAEPIPAQPVQDTLSLAEVEAGPGTVVEVPLHVRDLSGTPLDEGAGAGGEIQALGLRVDAVPATHVVSLGWQASGATAGLTPVFPVTTDGGDHAVVLRFYSEATAPLPLTLDAPAPGDELGRLLVEVAPGAPQGHVIDLVLAPSTSLVSGDALIEESVANGWLATVDGRITVGLAIFADGFESGDTSQWSGTVQ